MPALELVAMLAFVGVMAVVVAWVFAPLVRGATALATPEPRAVALLTRREATLATLRDLDADFAGGRIAESDYHALRAEVVTDGAATLAALDRLAAASTGRTAALTAAIEADVAASTARRHERTRATTREAGEGVSCASCGQVARSGDAFCARCGAALARWEGP
jgi:hypothetical protein